VPGGRNKAVLGFLAHGEAKIYNVYPESIFSGLSKIGGFFALIKLISLISYFHQILYEKKVAIEMHTNGIFSASD
jgi:hypothetical protein